MEKKEPAISIIIPMYNVEKYIGYCLDSLLNQTFKDYEIIMVDDASTDDTFALCQKAYGALPFVSLLGNEVNQGRGMIRNNGMKYARGKYIYFMDSDDELLPEALATLYQEAEVQGADVVHANIYISVYTEERMVPRKSLWIGCKSMDMTEGKLEGSKAAKLCYQAEKSLPMPWLNLYRRSFLLENNIVFPDLHLGEDNIFACETVMKAGCYVRINKMLNLYRKAFNEKQRMRKNLPRAFSMVIPFLAEWERLFAECSKEELPFEKRKSFMESWLRAQLKFMVYEVVQEESEEDFGAIEKYMEPVFGQGALFGALLVSMLGHDSGEVRYIEEYEKKKREDYIAFLEDLKRGGSKHKGDYVYLCSESRLAVHMEGAEPEFYCRAWGCLGDSLLSLGRSREALASYDKALSYAVKEEKWRLAVKKLATFYYVDSSTEKLVAGYGACAGLLSGLPRYTHDRSKFSWERRKIRVGILSPFFFNSDMFAILYGLVFCYDREQFEVFCYYCGRVEDGYTEAICKQVERFVRVTELPYSQRAEAIHSDGVDVLIELGGEELQETLPVLACRPASVQVADFTREPLCSSGFIDYYLTDDVVTPVGKQKAEQKQILLPCCYSYALRDDLLPSRRTPAKVNDFVTFGVVADYRQISDDMMTLWWKILFQKPRARLLVKVKEFNEEAMIVEARERFRDQGFDLGRVQFEGVKGDTMPRYLDIDILLSTYPMQDGAKLLDVLYMGVPVISLWGERSDTRLGLSLLSRVGLEGLATDSREEYVAKAVKLASNLPLLDELHKNLRKAMETAPDLNPARFVRQLEIKIREACTSGRH